MTSVGDLYEAIVDEAAYAALPAMVAEMVGARAGVIQRFEADGALADFQYSYYSQTLIADLAKVHPDGMDIWTEAGMRSDVRNRATLLDELTPLDAFGRSALWNEVLRPHGDDTAHSLGLIHTLDDAVLCVAAHRASGHGAFGAEHAARLDRISVDLHRIYRARRLLMERDDRVSRLILMLESGGTKVLMVGVDLRLVEASPAARVLIDRNDGLSLRAGRIAVHDPAARTALRDCVNRSIHRAGVTRTVFLCPRPSGAPPWRLTALPLPARDGGGCAILIDGGAPSADRLRIWLSQHYGASRAEIEVAEALLKGRTPEEIGAARRVSMNTVRTQIRRLLDKTGARGIGRLLALLASLA